MRTYSQIKCSVKCLHLNFLRVTSFAFMNTKYNLESTETSSRKRIHTIATMIGDLDWMKNLTNAHANKINVCENFCHRTTAKTDRREIWSCVAKLLSLISTINDCSYIKEQNTCERVLLRQRLGCYVTSILPVVAALEASLVRAGCEPVLVTVLPPTGDDATITNTGPYLCGGHGVMITRVQGDEHALCFHTTISSTVMSFLQLYNIWFIYSNRHPGDGGSWVGCLTPWNLKIMTLYAVSVQNTSKLKKIFGRAFGARIKYH